MSKNIQVPQGWEVKKLGEVGLFLKGKGIKKDELVTQGLPCIIYGQIYTTYDYYTHNLISFIPEYLKHSTTEIFKNDILFAGSGETKEEIGKSITYLGNTPAYAGGDIIILRQNVLISKYITFYLNSIGRKQLNKLGQGDSVVHIYKSSLEIINIPVPPLEEQKKIADILSLWDKAIEQTKELIAYKEKQKKGLMQALLTGKKRLQGFTDEWKTYKLKELLKECNIRNKNNIENNILSVSNKYGFIKQTDFFDKIVASKDTCNYKIIYINQFAYNPSRINVGSIALLKNYESGILSPMYIVFECINELYNIYFNYWIQSYLFMGIIKSYLSGSVRDSLNFKDMARISITIPPLDEQKAIADILSSADEEIELLNKQLELYTEQKKGLMQNLLTGKVRV